MIETGGAAVQWAAVKRLFTILSALSLLLFVAVVGLWVRSYFVHDFVAVHGEYVGPSTGPGEFESGWHRTTWDSTRGRVRFSSSHRQDGWRIAGKTGEVPPLPPRKVTHTRITPHLQDNYKWVTTGPEGAWNRRGFFAWRREVLAARTGDAVRTRYAVYGTPYWAPALVLGICPVWWTIWRARRRRRCVAAGLCPSCGYDLRATPGRCPECGMAPAEAMA